LAIVYLSSTFVDLKDEREAVTQWLIKARHEVRHSYVANQLPLVEACERDVEGADIYLLLAGQRYGEVPAVGNPASLSITELEFRAAQRAGKPIVALFQSNPPFDLSDHAGGDAQKIAALKRFHEAVKQAVTPDRFANEEQLIGAVSTGVTEAARKLEDKRREHAPPITPGVNRPHPRLLSRSLLLVHAAGTDEALARRLSEALGQRGIDWKVERFAWRPEDGLDWRDFDRRLTTCRAAAWLLTAEAAPRLAAAADPWQRQMALALQQCGYTAAFVVGGAAAEGALDALGAAAPLRQRHALDAWAAGGGAITPDLAQAVAQVKAMHPDIDDPGLVGLPCAVLAMTQAEARELRDQPGLLDGLAEEPRQYLAEAVARLQQAGLDWTARYGPQREDWQPFGAHATSGEPWSAMALLREVAQEINRQPVMPRRDQEALVGHRIRLRPYPLDPLLADDADWQALFEQVAQRRCLLLADELSLCHPRVRGAAADLLADTNVVIATIAPFDPPAHPVEDALRGNGVLRLGSLRTRFLIALDPQCELNLSSAARLRRWLRQSMPETLAGLSASARDERRAQIRQEAGLA
jgi:hypothetical protein